MPWIRPPSSVTIREVIFCWSLRSMAKEVFHDGQGSHRQGVDLNTDGRAVHAFTGRLLQYFLVLLQQPAQSSTHPLSPSVMIPATRPDSSTTAVIPSPFLEIS